MKLGTDIPEHKLLVLRNFLCGFAETAWTVNETSETRAEIIGGDICVKYTVYSVALKPSRYNEMPFFGREGFANALNC